MKELILGMVIMSSATLYAQDNFDHKAERQKNELESVRLLSDLEILYKDLYDAQGNVVPSVQKKIDDLNAKIRVNGAKTLYLYNRGFQKITDQYKTSDILTSFRQASNRYAAITAKDSKGQIISHESLNDLISSLYDKDISSEYGCYDENNSPSSHLPYEEDQASYADSVMQTLGYNNYLELEKDNKSSFCEIDKSIYDEDTHNQCNGFLSGMRINVLRELEIKAQQKFEEITKIGYFIAADSVFLELYTIQNIKQEVSDQIENIEGLCAEQRLRNTLDVFNYLESEVEKDGITIEFSNFNIDQQKVIRE